MANKNKFTTDNGIVKINYIDFPMTALVTYSADYYNELVSRTWRFVDRSKNENPHYYVTNNNLGDLHRYVMAKWCGKEILEEMTKKGYVVDHMDNNGLNCQIENLWFLPREENTSKGLTTDKKIANIRHKVAISMYRDYSTGHFQVMIFVNANAFETKYGRQIDLIKLLYDKTNDYLIVLNDIRSLIDNLRLNKKIDLTKMNYSDFYVEEANNLVLAPDEMACIVNQDGTDYILKQKGIHVIGIPMDKGWQPRKSRVNKEERKKDGISDKR